VRAPADVLFDMPVSNHGARCRIILKAKGLQDSVVIQTPSSIGGLQSAEYKGLNPNGKMPLLVTGENRYPIAESDTIARYFIEKYAGNGPSFVPNDSRLRVISEQIVRQHDIYISPIQGCMYKAPGTVFSSFGTDRGKALDELVKQIAAIEMLLVGFDKIHGSKLRSGGYLCGDSISLADATLFPTMVFCHFMLPKFFDVSVPGKILSDWYHRFGSEVGAASEVKAEIESALRGWEAAKRWDPILEEKKRIESEIGSRDAMGRWGRQLTASLLIGSSIFMDLDTNPSRTTKSYFGTANLVAHADSTGKMSTKLTARKRYLPRIVTGASEFDLVAKTPNTAESDAFLIGKDSKGASLVRAMRLYGASLRKGEVPDAISREADELCSSFQLDLERLASSRSQENIVQARKSLQRFLEFAKITL